MPQKQSLESRWHVSLKFVDAFGSVEKCEVALEQTRRPDGFRCPTCGSEHFGEIHDSHLTTAAVTGHRLIFLKAGIGSLGTPRYLPIEKCPSLRGEEILQPVSLKLNVLQAFKTSQAQTETTETKEYCDYIIQIQTQVHTGSFLASSGKARFLHLCLLQTTFRGRDAFGRGRVFHGLPK